MKKLMKTILIDVLPIVLGLIIIIGAVVLAIKTNFYGIR